MTLSVPVSTASNSLLPLEPETPPSCAVFLSFARLSVLLRALVDAVGTSLAIHNVL